MVENKRKHSIMFISLNPLVIYNRIFICYECFNPNPHIEYNNPTGRLIRAKKSKAHRDYNVIIVQELFVGECITM